MTDDDDFVILGGVTNPEPQPKPEPKRDPIELITEQEHETQRQIEEAQQLVRTLEDRRRELVAQKRALFWAERQRLAEEAEAERRKQELEKAAQQQAALLAKTLEFEKLTSEKRWGPRAYDHQKIGAGYMAAAERGLLADSMGTGKTLTSIIWLDYDPSISKTLVVAPNEVISNFKYELDHYSDRPVISIANQPKAKQRSLLNTAKLLPRVVVLVNYESWFRNKSLLDDLIEVNFDSLVADEAHRMKETDKAPYQGVSKIVKAANSCPICHSHDGIALNSAGTAYICQNPECGWSSQEIPKPKREWRSVQRLLLMTGTPILNRPNELFALLNLIDDETFKYANQFENDYCVWRTRANGSRYLDWREGQRARLATQLSGYYLRRTINDVGIDLPDQEIITHKIAFEPELYPLQAKIMKTLATAAQMEYDAGNVKTITDIMPLITRQRQAALWPGGIKLKEQLTDEFGNLVWDWEHPYNDGTPRPVTKDVPIGDWYRESQKLDVALDLIQDLNDDGHRVVVFSQFTTALEELTTRLNSLDDHPEHAAVLYTGNTPTSIAESLKVDFNRELIGDRKPEWMNLIANYKKGGVGANFTAATAIIILDSEWSPGLANQALARVNRIGQTEKTQVHILTLDTDFSHVDAWMEMLIQSKARVVASFDDSMAESSAVANELQADLMAILDGSWTPPEDNDEGGSAAA